MIVVAIIAVIIVAVGSSCYILDKSRIAGDFY